MPIQDTPLEFSTKYRLTCFFKDLTKIWDNTFQKKTIKHAFEKSSMWPIDANKCVEQFKIFASQKKITTVTEDSTALSALSQV